MTDEEATARSAAFELAGAFSANDGYKLRDGFFSAKLKAGESKVFAVNLYSGNSYWFSVGTEPSARKMGVVVFDEGGKPLPVMPYEDGPRAAAGFTAAYSGTYFIKVTQLESESAESSTACLLYAYK